MITGNFMKFSLAMFICSGIGLGIGCSSNSTTTQTIEESDNHELADAKTGQEDKSNSDNNFSTGTETQVQSENTVETPMTNLEIEKTVHFDFDSDKLSTSEEEKLQALVSTVDNNRQETTSVTIEGYADATGPEEYNKHLSKQRAQKVEEYLKARDIEVSSWDVEAHGEDNPAASNENKAGRAENRRVVVTVKSDRQQPRLSTR
jgi:outer membrane protein OmpA-like peptidoglycan-associated protein